MNLTDKEAEALLQAMYDVPYITPELQAIKRRLQEHLGVLPEDE